MSSRPNRRQNLLMGLGMTMREMSGLSVLHSNAMAARLGINGTDLECLDIIRFGSEITAGKLAKTTGLTLGAMTTVLDRLEAVGLVRRQRDHADRRKIFVTTTALVETKAEPLGAPMRDAVTSALSRYSESELALLDRMLKDVCEGAKRAIAELSTPAKSRRRTTS